MYALNVSLGFNITSIFSGNKNGNYIKMRLTKKALLSLCSPSKPNGTPSI